MYICLCVYICISYGVNAHIYAYSSLCLAPTSLLLLSSLPLSSLLLSLPRVSHFLVSLLLPSSRCSIMHPLELHSPCLPLFPALSLFFPSIIYPWELHSLSLPSSSLFLSLSVLLPLLSVSHPTSLHSFFSFPRFPFRYLILYSLLYLLDALSNIYIYANISIHYLSSMKEYVACNIIILYIDTYNVQDNWTALHFAAMEGHTAAIEMLLKAGADLKALDKVSIGICMHVYTCMRCAQYI
jgi:hypothetical protein